MSCPRLSENLSFSLYLFKNARKPPKMISFWQNNVKHLHKYFPVATGTMFSPKLILETKLKSSIQVAFTTKLP